MSVFALACVQTSPISFHPRKEIGDVCTQAIFARHSHKLMGWKACTLHDFYLYLYAAPYLGLLTHFASCFFVAGLELRRRILEVISRSQVVDSCGFGRLLFSVGLTSDRLNMVFMPLLHDRCVEFGSFRKFMGFSASHVYIFDNKGSEIFTAA